MVWMLQANQTTQPIVNYLKLLKTRIEDHLNLVFWVPDASASQIDKLDALDPIVIETRVKSATLSLSAYQAKREALNPDRFSHGLLISDALLLDDLGGGSTQIMALRTPSPKDIHGLVVQIPSPLGSSEVEEKCYHAAILWARQHHIPSIGYELLPLDIKWSLAATMPNGIITRYPESHMHLKTTLPHNHIWQIPTYESAIFSPVSTQFHIQGVTAAYHYKNTYNIPTDRTILYIPHNIAMVYEYKTLISILSRVGKKLHLMFGTGDDQVRGGYTHTQTIEMVYEKELEQFASYAFHDMNLFWEMMAADAVVSCSSDLAVLVAEKELPCIIFDPQVPEMSRGNKTRVHTETKLMVLITALLTAHTQKTELAEIMMMTANAGKTDA